MKHIIAFIFLVSPSLAFTQITGKVTNEKTGEPLPYATIYVRNTSNGTVSNVEGDYRLSVGKGAQEIVFQYIGYKQRIENITVGDKAIRLDVRLESANLELQEAIVSSIDPGGSNHARSHRQAKVLQKESVELCLRCVHQGLLQTCGNAQENTGPGSRKHGRHT